MMDGLLSRCLGFKGLGDRPDRLPSSGGGDGALRLELSALDATDLVGRAVRRGAGSSLGMCLTAAAASSLKAILATDKTGGDCAGVVSLCLNMAVTRVARSPGSGDSRLLRRCTALVLRVWSGYHGLDRSARVARVIEATIEPY